MENGEGNYFIINAMGRDRIGLVAMLSRVVSNAGYNIIDFEQSSPHGIFSLIMIIEPTIKAIDKPMDFFHERFNEIAAGTQLTISINPFKGGLRKESKSWLRFLWVGPDRVGMIATFSDYTGKNNVNIHYLKMISRSELIAAEAMLDISELAVPKDDFIAGLKEIGKKLGLQIIIESENAFKKKRKLMILDLDENQLYIQGVNVFLDELRLSDKANEMVDAIKKKTDLIEIKRLSLQYLQGLSVEGLKEILSTVKISPGTEELVYAMKLMEYTIALMSNSLNFFTDMVKERLNLEYAFGNAIEVKNNKITGKFVDSLEMNPQKKLRLINWLATMEKVPEHEVNTFGSDDRDPLLSNTAGLKLTIGFDYTQLRKWIKEKKYTVEQILAVLINVGGSDEFNDKIKKLKV